MSINYINIILIIFFSIYLIFIIRNSLKRHNRIKNFINKNF